MLAERTAETASALRFPSKEGLATDWGGSGQPRRRQGLKEWFSLLTTVDLSRVMNAKNAWAAAILSESAQSVLSVPPYKRVGLGVELLKFRPGVRNLWAAQNNSPLESSTTKQVQQFSKELLVPYVSPYRYVHTGVRQTSSLIQNCVGRLGNGDVAAVDRPHD